LLVNIKVTDRNAWETDREFHAAIKAMEDRLAGDGRVNVRASGTEKLVRVMVEGADETLVRSISDELSAYVKQKWGS
jgi:phosphoglucosamine mutase